MSTVERLLKQFIAADRAGGRAPDPQAYITQAGGADREELLVLLDEYLARAPRRAFDAAAFAASPARELTDDLLQALDGDAGTWPALLPRLRHRARLSRAQLVAALAQRLGVPGREQAVLGYYHAMEQGTLPADGVTDRVLDALGAIVGETAAALRAAGENIVPRGAAGGAAGAFARVAEPDVAYLRMAPPAPAPADRDDPAGDDPAGEDSAAVDALFTGRRSGP